ncbi:MAG TPA: ribosome biogenesis GTP-binding protein YihA/YsxC [Stellaceae bacterium]|jgi:GTP-binding protein|nr:ribosome biogenesis GTP-binding protein YihA/YsxC [Stellaceae bacterium]
MPAAVYPAEAALDAETEERGRLLFAAPCRFIAGATNDEAIPPDSLPEIAFVGRSNVGKSSLVNALTGQSALARVSKTPGRTRQINFFALGERLMLVDLPGYGYAEAPKREIARWTGLIARYLKGRASLRRVLLLLDARFGIKETDKPLLKQLDECAVSFQAVLTKCDLVEPVELQQRLAGLAQSLAKHVAAHPVIHLTSAQNGAGIAALRASLADLAEARSAR